MFDADNRLVSCDQMLNNIRNMQYQIQAKNNPTKKKASDKWLYVFISLGGYFNKRSYGRKIINSIITH